MTEFAGQSKAQLIEQLHQMRAEKATLEQERELFFSGTVVVFRWRNTKGWPVDYASPNAIDLLGYSVDEFYDGNLNYASLIPVSDFQRVSSEVENACREGVAAFNHQPYRIRHKNGSLRWLQDHSVIIRDQKGEITHFLGYVFDITNQKLAEDQLHISEARAKAILDNASAVIFIKDLEGRYLQINRRFERLFNCSEQAIVGKCDHDLFPCDLADALRENDLRVLENNGPMEFDEWIPHNDSFHTYLSLKFPLYDNAGRAYAVCGIATDITERKMAEKAIRKMSRSLEIELQAREGNLAVLTSQMEAGLAKHLELRQALTRASSDWEKTFNAVPDPIAILDTEYRIVRANKAMAERLGKPFGSIVNERCYLCVHKKNGPLENCPNTRLLKDGQCHSEEIYEENLGGWFQISVSPLFDSEDKLSGSIHIAHDITDRKKMEDERLSLAKEQKIALVREVHHQIKNHLHGLIGLLQQYQNTSLSDARMINRAISQIYSIATVYGLHSQRGGADIRFGKIVQGIVSTTEKMTEIPIRNEMENDGSFTSVIDSHESVAVALVINELFLNAVKHATFQNGDRNIRIKHWCDEGQIVLTIKNPGVLPDGFDYQMGNGLNTGLDLVRSMLPGKSAELSITGKGGVVVARLLLKPPLVMVGKMNMESV